MRKINHIRSALIQLIDLCLREEGVSLIPKGWWRHKPSLVHYTLVYLMKGARWEPIYRDPLRRGSLGIQRDKGFRFDALCSGAVVPAQVGRQGRHPQV